MSRNRREPPSYLRRILPVHRVDRRRHGAHARRGRRVHVHQRVVMVVVRGSGLRGSLRSRGRLRAGRVALRAHVRGRGRMVVALTVDGAVIGGQVGVVVAAVVGVGAVWRGVVDLHW